jgi:hypothetical protein
LRRLNSSGEGECKDQEAVFQDIFAICIGGNKNASGNVTGRNKQMSFSSSAR